MGGRAVTLARFDDERRSIPNVDPPTAIRDRALGAKLIQRDGHGMPRTADHLGQRVMGHGQPKLVRLVGRDQQPSRQPLAVRVDTIARCRDIQVGHPAADVRQHDTPDVLGLPERAQELNGVYERPARRDEGNR